MRKTLVIASTLPAAQNAALRAHPGVAELIEMTDVPWKPPAGAAALFTFQTQWKAAPAEQPAGWPADLAWLQVASAGVDTFPRWALDVPLVTRARGVQAPAIAEYVIGAVFAHEKRLWELPVRRREDWTHRMLSGVAGKTVGIAGMGSIGAEVARLALALGMKVTALTRRRPVTIDGIASAASLPELFGASDHVVLSLPLTPETRGCVDAACLAAAKPGLHLINIARGAIIDTSALLAALDAGRLSAATLDVTDPEPLPAGHPLYVHPRVRLTPHVSGSSELGDARLNAYLLGNIDRYLAGEPVPGQVETGRGY